MNRKQKATKMVKPDKIANMADNLGEAKGGGGGTRIVYERWNDSCGR